MTTSREVAARAAREMDELKDSGREFEGLTPVKANVSKEPRAVFSIRLSTTELTEISKAAKSAGTNVGDFVREAALTLARGEKQPPLATEELYEALDRLDEASQSLRAKAGLRRRKAKTTTASS